MMLSNNFIGLFCVVVFFSVYPKNINQEEFSTDHDRISVEFPKISKESQGI